MNEVGKSSVNRRAQSGYGITSLSVTFPLLHVQNIALTRDELKNFLEVPQEERKHLNTEAMITAACKILDFIVQKDFVSPSATDLWSYDPFVSTLDDSRK